MSNLATLYTRAEVTEMGESRLLKIIDYGNKRVEIPINRDGSIRWFDDSQLIRKTETA